MKQSLRRLFLILVVWSSAAAAQDFVVSDIRLQGLQRVSAGTVFNLLPIQVGDRLDEMEVRHLIRVLFGSGYFSDVRMARDNDVLVITVTERPAIESIELEGNKAIKSDALLEGLGQQGLKEGEIFKQATLERVGVELERQYVSQGRYGATIDTDVEELPDLSAAEEHAHVRPRDAFEEAIAEAQEPGERARRLRRLRAACATRASPSRRSRTERAPRARPTPVERATRPRRRRGSRARSRRTRGTGRARPRSCVAGRRRGAARKGRRRWWGRTP